MDDNLSKETDYSAIRQPLATSVNNLFDYVRSVDEGLPEIKHTLLHEVDVILECKLCRKLFRSLANLIMHKRAFCKSSYRGSTVIPDTFKAIPPKRCDSASGVASVSASVDNVAESRVNDGSAKEASPLLNETNTVKAGAMIEPALMSDSTKDEVSPPSPLVDKNTSTVDDDNWRTFCDIATLTCNICSQSYSSLKTLKFHCLNLHGKMRTFYSCLYCKLVFCQPWSCRRHMERSHNKTREQLLKLNDSIKKKSFAVPLSQLNDKGMPNMDDRARKLLVKTPTQVKPKSGSSLLCRDGLKGMCTGKKRKSSLCSVGSDKAFSCYNCGREYDVKGSLNKHINRRSCFDVSSSDLKSRRRELSSTLSQEQLQKVNKFTDRKRLQCKYCSRRFTNISNLNRHVVRHVGVSRFRCKLCEFKCYNTGECRRHLLHTHKKTAYQKYILSIDDEGTEADENEDANENVLDFTPNVVKRESVNRRKQDLTNVRRDYSPATRNSARLSYQANNYEDTTTVPALVHDF